MQENEYLRKPFIQNWSRVYLLPGVTQPDAPDTTGPANED